MVMTENGSKKLSIFGVGASGISDMTVAAYIAIKEAEKVFTLNTSPDLLSFLNQEHPRFENMTKHHSSTDNPSDVYAGIVSEILDDARNWENAVFIVSGNPWLLCRPVRELSKASGTDLNVEVYPGISCLDHIPNTLSYDFSEYGVQVLEASRMMLYSAEINPALNLMLLQPSAYHTSRFENPDAIPADVYQPLSNYLRQFYDSDHQLIIVISGPGGTVKETTIGGFPELASEIRYAASFFIPADVRKINLNSDFAQNYSSAR